MAGCYHPLLGVRSLTPNPDTGKYPVRVFKTEFKPDYVEQYGRENIVQIPCGKCIGCRLQYSRVWADRCMAEASSYEHNIFLTLTYNNECLPPKWENSPVNSLVKRDLQLFIKRLRKALPDQKIRYFACGEYGPQNMRPHYHLILFNCNLPDKKMYYINQQGFMYFTSKIIHDCWYPEEDSKLPKDDRRSMGFHTITDCNWHTCAYTARYIVKKQKGKNSSIYEQYNYQPEFTLMSRKPGIGRDYFDKHAIEIYYDGAFLPTEDGHIRIYPNKYYDDLFDIEYPDAAVVLDEVKQDIIENNNKLKSNLTSLSYNDMLRSEEINKISQTKALKRKEVF